MEVIKEACGGKLPYRSPKDIGTCVRHCIDDFYLDELDREPTEGDLRELIEFVGRNRGSNPWAVHHGALPVAALRPLLAPSTSLTRHGQSLSHQPSGRRSSQPCISVTLRGAPIST